MTMGPCMRGTCLACQYQLAVVAEPVIHFSQSELLIYKSEYDYPTKIQYA